MFALTYGMKGITYESILEMSPAERTWFVKRFQRQITKENDAMKAAAAKGRKKK